MEWQKYFWVGQRLLRTILNEKILQLSSTKNTRVNEVYQSSNSVCDNLQYTKIFTWLGVSEYGEMGSKNELTTYKIKDKVLQIPHADGMLSANPSMI